MSISSFVLSTVEPLHTTYREDFQIIETLTALVFTAEYVARVYALPEMRRSPSGHDSERLHPSRIRWIFTDYYSLIDIVSFLPFYLDLVTPRDDIPVGCLYLTFTHLSNARTHTSNTNTGDSVSSCTSYRAYASRGGSTPSRLQLLRSCTCSSASTHLSNAQTHFEHFKHRYSRARASFFSPLVLWVQLFGYFAPPCIISRSVTIRIWCTVLLRTLHVTIVSKVFLLRCTFVS